MSGSGRSTLEHLQGWGMLCHARSRVYRPRDAGEVAAALADARDRGLTVVNRGAGQSYGDAALNQGGATLLTTALDEVLDFDPVEGTARVGAGVTFEGLWKRVLPYGWWPPVVPGTMEVTVGGALAMNVHGKNQSVRGSLGEHVEALTVVRADGTEERLRAGTADFDAVIGVQGLTGTIVDATLRLHRIHSGYLDVEARAAGSLEETLELLEEDGADPDRADYAVAWIDTFRRASSGSAGRGVLHFARYLPSGHRMGGRGLSVEDQHLPGRILGLVPRRRAWRALKPFARDRGMRALSAGRYLSGRLRSGRRYRQSHAAFHFLLDYVPGWKRIYAPHGLIQYQLFVPADAAPEAFRDALRLQRKHGVFSWLGVIKRHRADRFAGSYSVDGFSLALDFPVQPRRLDRLARLCADYDALLRASGGRIYAAKDAWSTGRLGRLPAARDPLFSSNLVRRWGREDGGTGPNQEMR